jgi:two-component system, NarL family, invasion response regulator UvrY
MLTFDNGYAAPSNRCDGSLFLGCLCTMTSQLISTTDFNTMPVSKKTSVALVDDHTLFRKGMLELINGFGQYHVTLEAENGKMLIRQLCAEIIPDIVVLDVCMPEMDGFETAVWLRRNYPTVKVLAFSLNNEEQIVRQMITSGVKGYLLKTSDPAEIQKALETLAAGGSYLKIAVKP